MITLYALAQSRSIRIVWLLELLGVEYELKQYQRQGIFAPDEMKRIHPLGKAPILQDGDLILTESGAIVDYLISTYGQGKFAPHRQDANYWHYQRWLHYAEGSLMPFMIMALVFYKVEHGKMPFFVKPIARQISQKTYQQFLNPQMRLHLSAINQELSDKPWLMGDDLTGADIMMSFALLGAKMRYDISPYPHILRYLQQIERDSAYQRAIQKAGEPMLNMKQTT